MPTIQPFPQMPPFFIPAPLSTIEQQQLMIPRHELPLCYEAMLTDHIFGPHLPTTPHELTRNINNTFLTLSLLPLTHSDQQPCTPHPLPLTHTNNPNHLTAPLSTQLAIYPHLRPPTSTLHHHHSTLINHSLHPLHKKSHLKIHHSACIVLQKY